jgi:hypothetical protein
VALSWKVFVATFRFIAMDGLFQKRRCPRDRVVLPIPKTNILNPQAAVSGEAAARPGRQIGPIHAPD